MILLLTAQNAAQEEAFNAFATRLEPIQTKLYGFIRSIVKSEYTADDVFQDTVESALRHLDSLSDTEKFKSWIFQIAKNKAFDELRRKNRRGEAELTELPPEDDESPIELLIVKRENERRLLEAINALDPTNARIMTLRHYYGMRYADIAKLLQMTEVTLRSRHHRVLAQLRRALEEDAQ